MKPDYKLVAKAKYIHLVSDLAAELWGEVYKKLYPKKQLDALLDTLQSPEAIEAQIDDEVNYFIVVLGGKPVGYFSWKMVGTSLHLTNLYLKPEVRGKGLGRDIVQYCERLGRADGKGRLYCYVHEKQLPVLAFFKQLRYKVLQPAPQRVAGFDLPMLELERRL